MNGDLAVGDFASFFREVHTHNPFPWQERLMREIAEPREQGEDVWPEVLDLPTAFGKTAALDIAVFHLALEADRGWERRAPVRIAFVVDRRLVVDDAYDRAKRIACALKKAEPDSVTGRVARRLRLLAGNGNPALQVTRLRGGIPREDGWARTPSQPTILCSTVDQIGSRLLFRGYGVSNSMKPVHAGLLGADCLILLDEAHLSEPFRQTLRWVKGYRGRSWRECPDASPWGVALLTATPAERRGYIFRASPEDFSDDELKRRWEAPKPARLLSLAKAGTAEKQKQEADAAGEPVSAAAGEKQRAEELVKLTLAALQEPGMPLSPAIAVVVNRIARARAVFQRLQEEFAETAIAESDPKARAEVLLLIGPARAVDRDRLAGELTRIHTGAERSLARPLVIVATQCIEAGVDIDLDGLITEAAPLDALRQRFGRLNRKGRDIQPFAAIVGDAKISKDDPVYGSAIAHTWNYLTQFPDTPENRKQKEAATVDLGLAAFADHLEKNLPAWLQEQSLTFHDLRAPRSDAPVLLPAHLDLLSQTAPIPNADPEVSLYLHGPNRGVDAVTVLWREDADPALSSENMRRLLMLMPPRIGEAIELPVWAVCQWLTQSAAGYSELADVPGPIPDEPEEGEKRKAFCWADDDDSSRWIKPREIWPGSTIVVPADYGGVDDYGWNPKHEDPATDVADKAAWPFAGRRFAVRVAPQFFDNDAAKEKLAEAIADSTSGRWQDLRDAVREVVQQEASRLRRSAEEENSPSAKRASRLDAIVTALGRLDTAKRVRRQREKDRVRFDNGVYGKEEDRARGVVFVAPFGIEAEKIETTGDAGEPSTTEDDLAGSFRGYAQPLEEHCTAVEEATVRFAEKGGLRADRIADLKVAAYLHDAGKADPRFQSWLAWGDALGPDPNKPSEILAKSGRWLPPQAREDSELPPKWRHEAFSVRLAEHTQRFQETKDPELVLWLIGTHHGWGRPLFPHCDPMDRKERTDLPKVLGMAGTLPPGPGPQSLAWDCDGLDWPALYERLKARYGVWELARMEAVVRLADHCASEIAARNAAEEGPAR